MRIRFSCSLKPQSGKQNFAIRLVKALKKKGIRIVKGNPDVNLVFLHGIYPNCVNILRLDNAWIDNKINSHGKNSKLKKTMKKCKAVIYQGNYSKKVCEKFIGKKSKYCMIPNGCDPSEFVEKYNHSRPYILAVSRWRPHKRLKEITLGFLESGIQKTYNLLIAGKPDFIIKDKAVVYLGKVKNSLVLKLIYGSEFISHLAFMDCCPNSVVESLVCGKNVLYSNSGGMKELVGSSGFCVNDRVFCYKMIDLYNPPPLDMQEVTRGYKTLISKPFFSRKDLYINTIAARYVSFINKLL